MKRLLLFILIIMLSKVGLAQFPNSHSQSNASTLEIFKGGLSSDSGLVYRYSFADTASANLGYLDNISGISIMVSDSIWVRNRAHTAWLNLGRGTAGNPTLQVVTGYGKTTTDNVKVGMIANTMSDATPLFQVGNLSNTPSSLWRYGISISQTLTSLPSTGWYAILSNTQYTGSDNPVFAVGGHHSIQTSSPIQAIEGDAEIAGLNNPSGSITVGNARGSYVSITSSNAGTKILPVSRGIWLTKQYTGGPIAIGYDAGLDIDYNNLAHGVGDFTAVTADTLAMAYLHAPKNGIFGHKWGYVIDCIGHGDSAFSFLSFGGKVRFANMNNPSASSSDSVLVIQSNGTVATRAQSDIFVTLQKAIDNGNTYTSFSAGTVSLSLYSDATPDPLFTGSTAFSDQSFSAAGKKNIGGGDIINKALLQVQYDGGYIILQGQTGSGLDATTNGMRLKTDSLPSLRIVDMQAPYTGGMLLADSTLSASSPVRYNIALKKYSIDTSVAYSPSVPTNARLKKIADSLGALVPSSLSFNSPLRLTSTTVSLDTAISFAASVTTNLRMKKIIDSLKAVWVTNGWSITGNAGITAGTNFIGTTDSVNLVFKTNGVTSGILDISNQNTVFGRYATTSGQYNTIIGSHAGEGNTGSFNVFVGQNGSGSIGSSVTAVGQGAGNSNGGSSVTLIGTSAGIANSGNYTVLIGQNSGNYNTGDSLTAVGALSAYSNTGARSTFLGMRAGANANPYRDIIALGYNSHASANKQLVLSDSITNIKATGIPTGAGSVLTDVAGNGILTLAAGTISGVTLGGNLFSLTPGNGIVGSAFNGSSNLTWRLDSLNYATLKAVQKKIDSLAALSFALTNGSGTTANGTAVDLGGVVSSTVNIQLNGGHTYSITESGDDRFVINSDGTFYLGNAAGGFPAISSTSTTFVVNKNTEISGTVTAGGFIGNIGNSATLNFGNTAAGSSTDLTIAVTGAVDGDAVALGVPIASQTANGVYSAFVSAPDVITVRFTNTNLATAIDPASGTFNVKLIR